MRLRMMPRCSFALRCPPLRHRPCSQLLDINLERIASISLEFPSIKLKVHHGTQNCLRELAVKVTVEALHARDDEARRKVLGNVRISAHAEGAAAVVCQSTLSGD